jgi:N-acyl-D-aspartate/D-glutamate deacylase
MRRTLTAKLLLVTAESSPAALRQPDFDILIRGGRVLDGSGNPAIRADVAIRGDRIVAIGDLWAADAATVVDARDRYVAPGFMDAHSHAAGALTGALRGQ